MRHLTSVKIRNAIFFASKLPNFTLTLQYLVYGHMSQKEKQVFNHRIIKPIN